MKRRSSKKSDFVTEDYYDEFEDINYQKYKRQKNLNRKKNDPYRDEYRDEWN